ncbi:oxidation resistance protein [Thalictrum thalictroides]|uniref:Oxidation resistance protein n=1 Tax=Thalictrum thalictroides TaxID=46969 RepID=A0A7J6X991_THATH|nr:oxidation resistance protein [Thalictrum thalictroides]
MSMMNGWKEKVANKISRVLADSSPSSPVSKFGNGNDSPIARSEANQTARPLSKEESNGSEKSVSSYLYSFLPTVSLDGYRSKRRPELRPFRSLSNKWKSKNYSSKDKQLDNNAEHVHQCENKEIPGTSEEGESQGRNIRVSVEKASTSHTSANCVPQLMDQSSFITVELYDFLQSSLPNIVKGCQWVMLYSTSRDGISLRTLLRKSVAPPGLCLLIVGDMQGAVFGGLLECPLKPTSKRKYQGTNQSFVFTTIYGQPRLFRATGANRYYYLCLNDILAFGGGGNFALCLDEDLLRGTSGPCDTFGNLCLAHNPEFEMKNVELWGFTHSSQYIT